MKTVNGWIQPNDLGRYGTDYDTRAGIAYLGLGADMPEDTIYPTAFVDADRGSFPLPTAPGRFRSIRGTFMFRTS